MLPKKKRKQEPLRKRSEIQFPGQKCWSALNPALYSLGFSAGLTRHLDRGRSGIFMIVKGNGHNSKEPTVNTSLCRNVMQDFYVSLYWRNRSFMMALRTDRARTPLFCSLPRSVQHRPAPRERLQQWRFANLALDWQDLACAPVESLLQGA